MLRGLLVLLACLAPQCDGAEARFGDAKVVGDPDDASCATAVTNQAGDFPSDAGCPRSGAARVYRLVDGEWVPEAYLKAVDSQAGDAFGTSVAMQGDTIMVGAKYEDRCSTAADDGEGSSDACLPTVSYAYRRVKGDFETDPMRWIPEAKIGETVMFGPNEPNARIPAYAVPEEERTRWFNWGRDFETLSADNVGDEDPEASIADFGPFPDIQPQYV